MSEKNLYMLNGLLGKNGYDWWWHSFTAYHKNTGEEKAFFIEYFVVNPASGTNTPSFGQLPNTTQKPSYVMIKAGHWGKGAKQIHRFFPIHAAKIARKHLHFSVEDCLLTNNSMIGSVSLNEEENSLHPEYMSDSGDMSWNLTMKKHFPFDVGYGTSTVLRKLNAFEMFWHVSGMKTEYEGTILLDGEEYEAIPEKSFGYADKNWGQNYTSPWIWISSCHLVSKLTGKTLTNSAFDIGGGKPKAFGIPFNRKILAAIFYENTFYEYNFSKFWKLSSVSFNCEETESTILWHVNGKNSHSSFELSLTCNKSDMLLINYESPDGKKRHNKLWNGGNGYGELKLFQKDGTLIDHLEIEHAGCEYGEYD